MLQSVFTNSRACLEQTGKLPHELEEESSSSSSSDDDSSSSDTECKLHLMITIESYSWSHEGLNGTSLHYSNQSLQYVEESCIICTYYTQNKHIIRADICTSPAPVSFLDWD